LAVCNAAELQARAAPRPSLASRVGSLLPGFVVGLVFVVFLGRLYRLASRYAVNIFFGDQWDFDGATLFHKHSLWEMFRWQHGPHRQGMGALVGWLAEPLFRWNSRVEAYLVISIIALAALCALLLKRRLFGPIAYSDVAIPLLFLTPIQYEALWHTANLAHGPMPLLLIVLYCLAWTVRAAPPRYALVVLINFLTIYTGFGVFLGLVTPVLLALDYCANRRRAPVSKPLLLVAELIALTSLASFFIGYTFTAAMDNFDPRPQSTRVYARFVALMFAHFFGATTTTRPARIFGYLLMAWMLAILALGIREIVSPRQDSPASPATAQAPSRLPSIITLGLIAYSFLFVFNAAYGRVSLGIEAAFTSRYAIYLELTGLGLYLFSLSLRQRLARNASLVFLVAIAAYGSLDVREPDRYAMQWMHDVKSTWKSCYLAGGEIALCDKQAHFWIYPHPEDTHLQEKLDYLKEARLNLFADAR
jgi:hypothetical protein